MKKVLVTGAHGYLASLARLYNSSRIEFSCVSHTDVDFSRPDEVEKYFEAADFDVCLHMAADATTAHCEDQPELTHRVNTESAIAIAKVCRERAKRMVFISTEQCFKRGPGQAPFFEDDEQASVSAYGRQKWRPTPGFARTSTTTSSCGLADVRCPCPASRLRRASRQRPRRRQGQ